ncbi:MAG: rhomboid family intramembrane serine protease [Muribaculaceae bacterium]|nr:rhomboid family intramembrane serine protease [Muribaculaceae bacterium]
MSANIRWNKPSIPPVTKHLIIINAILWIATMLLGGRDIVDLTKYLGLHFWKGSDFHFYQFFTYMFMHDSSSFYNGLMHIFFNMFTLFMFGILLEKVMGMKRFLLFYIVCGIGAGLVQELVWQFTDGSITEDFVRLVNDNGVIVKTVTRNEYFNMMVTVGASGAVFGILLAFAMLFPNIPLYIMFIPIPVKAKYAVIGFAVIELFFGVSGVMSSVAHFAHLGGMLFGLILLLYWKKKGFFNNYYVNS